MAAAAFSEKTPVKNARAFHIVAMQQNRQPVFTLSM